MTGADCVGLPLPHLGFLSLREEYSAWGLFIHARPDVVWLDQGLYEPLLKEDPFAMGVLLHEIVHYIDWHRISRGFDGYSSCDREALAWAISNTWLTRNGHYDLADWAWHGRYRGCSVG